MQVKWTENNFRNLCNICDKILNSEICNYSLFANPLLHIIRPHPIFLKSYESVLGCKKTKKIFKNYLSFFATLVRVSKSIGEKRIGFFGEAKKSEILIISHFIDSNKFKIDSDFYYGNLSSQLEEYGITAKIALINHTAASSKSIYKKHSSKNKPLIIFQKYLNISEEIKFIYGQIKVVLNFKKRAFFSKINEEKCVNLLAADGALGGNSITALRYAQQIKILVRLMRPKMLLITYEGHAWERLAFSMARSVDSNLVCVGYQHSLLFHMQHAIQRKLGSNYDPDIILTSGNVAKRRLLSILDLNGIRIETLGSIRATDIQDEKERPKEIYCLVIPEGIEIECLILFKYSVRCALRLPNIKFIWRLHPLLNFEDLKKKYEFFKHLPPNIFLSTTSIEEDVLNSTYALYRGSSAIVGAISSGVYPIYLKIPNEITIDPLYEVSSLRMEVIDVQDFEKIVNEDNKNFENLNNLKKYCNELLTPLNVSMIKNVLP